MAILNRFLIPTFALIFLFSACTQGQGPGSEAKVTTAGAEAVPDVCEKPENLDNILCKWVASELNINSGGQTANVKIFYNEAGLPYRIEGNDGQGKKSIMNLSYNDYGLWKMVGYSEPNPPESENFTREETRTNVYDSNGTIQSRTREAKDNGQLQSSEEKLYFYGSPEQIVTISKDGANNTTGGVQEFINRDPGSGKITSIEEISGPVPVGMTVSPTEQWSITTLGYDFDTGNLGKIEKESQNCLVQNRPCGQTLDPNVLAIQSIFYDDQGRLSKFNTTTDGEVDSNNQIVSLPHDPPDPDREMDCLFKYELQTQGRLAKMNPLEIFLLIVPPTGMNLNFTDKDLFTEFSCGAPGASSPDMTMTPRWARLWEVLPEGKPPGN